LLRKARGATEVCHKFRDGCGIFGLRIQRPARSAGAAPDELQLKGKYPLLE